MAELKQMLIKYDLRHLNITDTENAEVTSYIYLHSLCLYYCQGFIAK